MAGAVGSGLRQNDGDG